MLLKPEGDEDMATDGMLTDKELTVIRKRNETELARDPKSKDALEIASLLATVDLLNEKYRHEEISDDPSTTK
jgi:hypothetical protein